MDERVEFANTWEMGLVQVARRRLDTLTELDADFSGYTSTFDIDGALNELCAITDLIYESAFESLSTHGLPCLRSMKRRWK